MRLSVVLLTLIQYLPWVFTEEEMTLPFNFFLGPENEELSRDLPMAFRPEDGINYRQSYEGKYGRRGERLIALLGGGVSPLSIFDASMFGSKASEMKHTADPSKNETEAHGNEIAETTFEGGEESNITVSSTPSPDAGDESSSPGKTSPESYFGNRRYINIDRSSKNSDNIFQNIIPQESSYNVNPDGVIYNRLYGAVWNFGEKGLQNRFPPSFLPSSWPFLPSPFDVPNLVTPGVSAVGSPQGQSESSYAGPGEPSIVLQSYSYDR